MNLKIKIILLALVSTMFFTACSRESSQLFNEGQVALEEHDYTTAMEKLSDVLEGDSGNKVARDMYTQAMRMKRVEEYEKSEDYERALDEIEKVIALKNGSSKIIKEAEEKKKEYEKIIETLEKEREERKKNARETAASQADNVESDALKANSSGNKKEESSNSSSGSSSSDSKPSSGGSSDNSGSSGSSENSGQTGGEGGSSEGSGSSSGGESSGNESTGQ